MPDLTSLDQQIAELEAATAKLRASQRSRSEKLDAVKAIIAQQKFTSFELLEMERFQQLVEVRKIIDKQGFTPYELGLLSNKGSLEKHLASLQPGA